jgi:hypothetical protein
MVCNILVMVPYVYAIFFTNDEDIDHRDIDYSSKLFVTIATSFLNDPSTCGTDLTSVHISSSYSSSKSDLLTQSPATEVKYDNALTQQEKSLQEV